MTQAGVRRVGALATVAALAAVSLLASGCT